MVRFIVIIEVTNTSYQLVQVSILSQGGGLNEVAEHGMSPKPAFR